MVIKILTSFILNSNLCIVENVFSRVSVSRSVMSDSATPWTPLSMGFSRQEYWSGLPFPSPGDLPDPGIKPGSPTLQAESLPSEPPERWTF